MTFDVTWAARCTSFTQTCLAGFTQHPQGGYSRAGRRPFSRRGLTTSIPLVPPLSLNLTRRTLRLKVRAVLRLRLLTSKTFPHHKGLQLLLAPQGVAGPTLVPQVAPQLAFSQQAKPVLAKTLKSRKFHSLQGLQLGLEAQRGVHQLARHLLMHQAGPKVAL